MNDESSGWYIEDPRPIAAEAPYTFFLPDPAELAALAPGDHVKACFQYTIERVETWWAERMWVTIESLDAGRIIGHLANDPYEPLAPLRYGDTVTLELAQVVAVSWANPEAAPKIVGSREYWAGCMVDDCVVSGEEPVEYIYREDDDLAGPDDTHPDSGWRIRGRQGACDDAAMDARKAQYIALGAVLNRDDSWLALIDAPVGSAFMRDFETGLYHPCHK